MIVELDNGMDIEIGKQADVRGVSTRALVNGIMRMVVKDRLWDAVLDDTIPKHAKRMVKIQDRKAAILKAIDESPSKAITYNDLSGYAAQWHPALKALMIEGAVVTWHVKDPDTYGPGRKYFARAEQRNGA